MGQPKKSLHTVALSLTAAFLLYLSPAFAQTSVGEQPQQLEPAPSMEAAPAATSEEALTPAPAHAVSHKSSRKKSSSHHTHGKKKAHKNAHHKKSARKSSSHHHKVAKKAHKKHKKHKQTTEAPAPARHKEAAIKAVPLAKVETPKSERRANVSQINPAAPVRTVSYDFCLGYDNCVPHKYEAVMQGSHVAKSRVLEQTSDGNWNESKINPVMANDLGKMAAAEQGSDDHRPLTAEEKESIADHQGKIHAQLVGELAGGSAGKDQAKTMFRELGITDQPALEAYDAKLGKNETAVEAVDELAAERARTTPQAD